jgi:hypothetical protein
MCFIPRRIVGIERRQKGGERAGEPWWDLGTTRLPRISLSLFQTHTHTHTHEMREKRRKKTCNTENTRQFPSSEAHIFNFFLHPALGGPDLCLYACRRGLGCCTRALPRPAMPCCPPSHVRPYFEFRTIFRWWVQGDLTFSGESWSRSQIVRKCNIIKSPQNRTTTLIFSIKFFILTGWLNNYKSQLQSQHKIIIIIIFRSCVI